MGIFGRRKINERFSDSAESYNEEKAARKFRVIKKDSHVGDDTVNLEAAIDQVSYAPEKYTSVPSEADKAITVTCNGCNSEIPIISMRRN